MKCHWRNTHTTLGGAEGGRVRHPLVECGEDVVSKLDLGDGLVPGSSCADPESHYALTHRNGLLPSIVVPLRHRRGSKAFGTQVQLAMSCSRTCSHRGVLKTRSCPKRSFRPTVQRNTPPKLTSSPKQRDLMDTMRSVAIWRGAQDTRTHE